MHIFRFGLIAAALAATVACSGISEEEREIRNAEAREAARADFLAQGTPALTACVQHATGRGNAAATLAADGYVSSNGKAYQRGFDGAEVGLFSQNWIDVDLDTPCKIRTTRYFGNVFALRDHIGAVMATLGYQPAASASRAGLAFRNGASTVLVEGGTESISGAVFTNMTVSPL